MILSAVRDELAVSWDGDELLTVLPESERAEVEALRDGDFVHNLREAGFTVMVDQRVVEALLIEHPGHPDQKVHGRKGGPSTAGPSTSGVQMMPRIGAKFSGTHPAAGGAGNNPTLEALADMGADPAALDLVGKVLHANGFLDDNPAARAASAAKISDEIRDLDYERGNLIFPNGEVYRGVNGTDNMSFVPASLQRFSSIDIHNHPSGSSTSPQDVNPFDGRVRKEEIRVVSRISTDSLTPGPSGWGDESTYHATADAAYARVSSGGYLSGRAASVDFWNEVAPSMGWTMTSTATPSTPSKLEGIFARLGSP